MRVLILVFTTFCLNGIYCQELSVLSSSGDSHFNDGIRLDWTFGEAFIENRSINALHLNEGFHQFISKDTETNTIEHFKSLNIHIGPNPFKNFVYIQTNTNLPSHIKVYDALGHLIVAKSFSNSSPIDLSESPKGIYYIDFTNSDGKGIFKLIKY